MRTLVAHRERDKTNKNTHTDTPLAAASSSLVVDAGLDKGFDGVTTDGGADTMGDPGTLVCTGVCA